MTERSKPMEESIDDEEPIDDVDEAEDGDAGEEDEEELREVMVLNAVRFLQNPQVQSTPLARRLLFLQQKGVTQAEIDEAVRRVHGSRENANKTTTAKTKTKATRVRKVAQRQQDYDDDDDEEEEEEAQVRPRAKRVKRSVPAYEYEDNVRAPRRRRVVRVEEPLPPPPPSGSALGTVLKTVLMTAGFVSIGAFVWQRYLRSLVLGEEHSLLALVRKLVNGEKQQSPPAPQSLNEARGHDAFVSAALAKSSSSPSVEAEKPGANDELKDMLTQVLAAQKRSEEKHEAMKQEITELQRSVSMGSVAASPAGTPSSSDIGYGGGASSISRLSHSTGPPSRLYSTPFQPERGAPSSASATPGVHNAATVLSSSAPVGAAPVRPGVPSGAGGPPEEQTARGAPKGHSKSFLSIMEMVSRGETPPDVQTVDDAPAVAAAIPAPSADARPKPWEARRQQRRGDLGDSAELPASGVEKAPLRVDVSSFPPRPQPVVVEEVEEEGEVAAADPLLMANEVIGAE